MALASLHRETLLNEQDIHGTLIRCKHYFGYESSYHLNGILIEGLRQQGRCEGLEEGWFETITRICPREVWEPLNDKVGGWFAERSEVRKEMDQSLEDEVWEQELINVRHHPEINPNGWTFLESLQGRPTLAKALVRSGALLKMVLQRKKMADDYTAHMVLDLHQDLEKSQWEAEREYLLLPDEASAPNLDLNNWDNH